MFPLGLPYTATCPTTIAGGQGSSRMNGGGTEDDSGEGIKPDKNDPGNEYSLYSFVALYEGVLTTQIRLTLPNYSIQSVI